MIRTDVLGDFGEWFADGTDVSPWDYERDDNGRPLIHMAHSVRRRKPDVYEPRFRPEGEWDREEIVKILFPNGCSTADLADELGRTQAAIRNKRRQIRMNLHEYLDSTADQE